MNAVLNNPTNSIEIVNLTDFDLTDVDYTDASEELSDIEAESYALFRKAVDDIKIIKAKYTVAIASSFAKDSTVTTLAALQAHKELIVEGAIAPDSPFLITNINTLVENHLITILVSHERRRLNEWGEKNGIIMDIRVATPNLSRTWAAMFLSGLKVLSLSKLNADCSEELKIRNAEKVEKQLAIDYKGKIVTLLGSRLSESTRRKASLVSRSQHNKTAEELVEFADKSRKDRVFAPIVNMTADHVWTLLRRAGTNPIVQPSKGFEPIPSYCDNHRLLNIVYGDSTEEGSCPTSSKRIKGDNASAGGCGKSSRMGCYTCLKPIEDSSSKILSRSKRHGVISANMLKVRDYMMHIGADLAFRTWHTRAMDFTTGAIAAQPNVLNAETLDYLIKLFCQITVDEEIRAQSFAEKVQVGDELLDEGYADIFADNELSVEDKSLFAKVYKEFAVEPLIAPMTRNISLYLSAIHSRDGVKLPPYRALHHWMTLVEKFKEEVDGARYEFNDHSLEKAFKKVTKEFENKGLRLPYPNKDPRTGVQSEIPDAVMILPKFSMNDFNYIPHTGGVDLESAEGCLVDSRLATTKLPYKYVKRMLDEESLEKLGKKKNTDLIEISGFTQEFELLRTFNDTPRNKPVRHKFSRRSIKKVSRAKGGYRVVERGRTSLDKPSFSKRTDDVNLAQKIENVIPFIYPELTKVYEPFLEIDEEAANAYEIDTYATMAWEDYDGLEHALKAHDDFVEGRKKWSDHIYFFGGTGPFESLMRWGVLNLNNTARRNTMMILKRTAYLGCIGLFRLDDKKFAEFVSQRVDTPSFEMSDFSDTKCSVQIKASDILPMKEYRSYKASCLLDIREDRNKNRKALKAKHQTYLASPVEYALDLAKEKLTQVTEEITTMSEQYAGALFSKEHNLFDSTEQKWAIRSTYMGYFRLIFAYTSSLEVFYELLPKSVVKTIKADITLRQQVENTMNDLNEMFVRNFDTGIDDFIYFIKDSCLAEGVFRTDVIHLDIDVARKLKGSFSVNQTKAVSYSLKDIPAAASFEIEW